MKTKTQKKERKALVKKITKKQKDLILRNYNLEKAQSLPTIRNTMEEKIRRKYEQNN